MITRRPVTDAERAEILVARDQALVEAAGDAVRARWAGCGLLGVGVLAGLIIGITTGFDPWWAMFVPLAGLGAPAGAALATWRMALAEEQRAAIPFQLEVREGLQELVVVAHSALVVDTSTERVWILYTDDGYGRDCLNNFKGQAEAAGLQVVYEAGYANTDTEFSAQLAAAEASGCEAFEVGSTPPVASLVVAAVRVAMPDLPITLGHGVCNQPFIATAGTAADGTVFPCGKVTVLDQVADSDPQKTVLQQYITDYGAFTDGEPISTFGGHGWDAVMMAVDALSSLEDGASLKEQRASVRDYLENNIKDWPGISGTFTMSTSDHNGLDKDSLLFVKVENGKWVAYPESEW